MRYDRSVAGTASKERDALDVERALEAIEKDNLSGATHIAAAAAETILAFSARAMEDANEEGRAGIERIVERLIQAHPSMAPIINLANRVLLALEGEKDSKKSLLAAHDAVEEVTECAGETTDKAASALADLVRAGDRITVYSASAAVFAGLRDATRGGTDFSVVCSEARPACEGVGFAKRLSEAGIKTTLISDAALFSRVPEATKVFVGADSVCAQGLVNKIGTRAAADLAKSSGIPFYGACTFEKFLPRGLDSLLHLKKGPPEEITPKTVPNPVIENPYFDLTPLNLVSGIVTEDGVLTAFEVHERIATGPVALFLQRMRAQE